jgi:hypothetical protein
VVPPVEERCVGLLGGVLPLRNNAFEPELAGVAKRGLAVALHVLVDRMPDPALASISSSVALRPSSGSRRRSSPFSSIRSKAYRKMRSLAR